MDIGPLVRVPFLDQRNGLISRPWLLFLIGIFERTGGTAGSTVDNVQVMDEYDDIAHALMYQNQKRIEEVALLAEFSPSTPASTYDVSMEFPQGLPQDLQRGSSPKFAGLTLGDYSVGTWTAVTYNAGDFTSNAGTWTVDAGDVTTFAYTIINKMMTVVFALTTTSTSGAGNSLQIAIPASKTAARSTYNAVGVLIDNGNRTTGTVAVAASGTNILIQRTDIAAFTDSVNATTVRGQITFEIS